MVDVEGQSERSGPSELMVQGRTIPMPVVVRAARSWIATYFVDGRRAQQLIDATGLEIAEARRGKSLLILGYVSYSDTDLGAYNEFTVSLIVRRHDAPPARPRQRSAEVRRSNVGVYIHHLPVDDEFSLEAGRRIWGYPKTMARFEVAHDGRWTSCSLHQDGAQALTLSIRDGGMPFPRSKTPPTYTFIDGTLRLTPWTSRPEGVRGRLGGARLVLGEGRIADDLRSLGLPKRALVTTNVRVMRATFGAAEVVHATPAPAH